ncbi:metal dependent phosphohydrolase [Capnocytophaga ochracea DSM 7271]|uniref:Metal dependent phosphohydrolase n=1 Tax=Capnocytophaga ochracea (strain ATCC 27872 / DSM 7271 / CCUG 9716 / JCM 12966 / NCTC 12371 / SS31 / VPI 2845) TaxID=521097 RepID=C7M839_CAPOD|nr:HD domain-containing protein [Capnocytophaga ochracea]ACU93299.1 metal dependent phosphohydrolase [Capnocytophaga ochracea DSM 7271]UAK51989.1 HD domain-containing protein [Capnocytophaga ochracea]
MRSRNKLKIINDPIYGFIHIPSTLVFDIIEHPYFQRLRRINQMGLSYLVFPGAKHTRFEHVLGCVFLMQKTVEMLRFKGVQISEKEAEGLYIAILLHDIGHGPFSHAMEHSIVEGISHEEISLRFMQELNKVFNGKLDTAIAIFQGTYLRKFMHQLISGQLDMDRADYLKRDSFYTGVAEGNINSERLISMLNVRNDELVVEEKGLYSVEKFLIARRLMYWQVYLHKTSVVAEQILIRLLNRAKELVQQGQELTMSTALAFFVKNKISKNNFSQEVLEMFACLDDTDIISAMKEWQFHPDVVLSKLSKMLLNRDLLKIKVRLNDFEEQKIKRLQKLSVAKGVEEKDIKYFVFTGVMTNRAYNPGKEIIKILTKNGRVVDLTKTSEAINLEPLSQVTERYYICYPK